MLEKTEGTVKNRHSRNTGNIGHSRDEKKTKNITPQKTKKTSNTIPTKNPRMNPRALEG
jgi:hypothetical protein